MKELNEQSKLSAEIAGPLPGPPQRGLQKESPYSRGVVRGSKSLRNIAYGRFFRPYGQSRRGQSNYRGSSQHWGLLGSPETVNAGNNSEVSVNKQVGYLAKYKDKWSLITKNHLVVEIASQCKIYFMNDSPPVQTCPHVNFGSLNKSPVSLMQNYLNSYHKES